MIIARSADGTTICLGNFFAKIIALTLTVQRPKNQIITAKIESIEYIFAIKNADFERREGCLNFFVGCS